MDYCLYSVEGRTVLEEGYESKAEPLAGQTVKEAVEAGVQDEEEGVGLVETLEIARDRGQAGLLAELHPAHHHTTMKFTVF